MQRCLELASNGLGVTAPNPLVGAVIVHNDRIIGEGYHTGFGKPHAEVEAVSQVSDHSLLKDSTLYVNLEPCNHHGKTPPCTDLILEKGFGRVVIGQSDSNAAAGGGIERLRSKGVEVITGIMEAESRWLNRRFNTFHEKKRPYLILKWAQSADGFVDSDRAQTGGNGPTWITDETCRRLVHKWRTEEQAILAGSGTVQLDNPSLNVRAWSGNNPLRITIDRSGVLVGSFEGKRNFSILDGTIPTLVYTYQDQPDRQNLEFKKISSVEPTWQQILADLYMRNIQSILIEGGPTLFTSLIEQNIWDEARVFIGPGWFGQGVRAPHFPYKPSSQESIGNSTIWQFHNLPIRQFANLRIDITSVH